MSTTPLLSIGMIFKNEERCIERCLQSLQPLREAISCELIMADTGAEDASRGIAERYADEVFDFEWIGDFAAARNAVMDRCHGKWYLTVDCDEWLDADISELLAFLNGREKFDFAFVVVRNYSSAELEKSEKYSDFHALRLIRMATGQRYHGAIHESWIYQEPAERLPHTILHHDGYLFIDPENSKNKSKRNMELLREKRKLQPDNALTMLQCIESGGLDADFIQYIRDGVQLVIGDPERYVQEGPAILCHAAETARVREMPEFSEWIALAEKLFPDSILVRVGLSHTAFMAAYEKKEWEKAIRYGEIYQKGLQDYRSPHPSQKMLLDLRVGSPLSCDADTERGLLIGLANAYLQVGQGEQALETLRKLDVTKLYAGQLRSAVVALSQLHAETEADILPIMANLYQRIDREEPSKQKQQARLAEFNTIAAIAFSNKYRKEEKEHKSYHRPAYTVFACLADQCEAGRGAKIMMADNPAEMRSWLEKVEGWQALPIEALEHALQAGVAFPLADKPLPQEVLDGLAARLTHDANPARQMALALPENAEFESLQSLYWAQALVLAALHSFDWSLGKASAPASKFFCPAKKKDEKPEERPRDTPEVGLALVRRFAQVESTLLPLLYAPALLTEENAALLPPMHRWGLYCAWALDALDAGRPREYLTLLRKALKACPGQKDIVQFLLDRFLEDARPKTNPELLALAEKIRAILAAYSPDDPAVQAIRESPAYKQVAWIIEETPGVPVQ